MLIKIQCHRTCTTATSWSNCETKRSPIAVHSWKTKTIVQIISVNFIPPLITRNKSSTCNSLCHTPRANKPQTLHCTYLERRIMTNLFGKSHLPGGKKARLITLSLYLRCTPHNDNIARSAAVYNTRYGWPWQWHGSTKFHGYCAGVAHAYRFRHIHTNFH